MITATLRNRTTTPTPGSTTGGTPGPAAVAPPPTTTGGLPPEVENSLNTPPIEVVSEPVPDQQPGAQTDTGSSGAETETGLTRTGNQFTDDSGGGLEGDFDQEDLKLPQLKIVNGSGELSQRFNQGTLLLADEQLWEPPKLTPGATNPITQIVPVKIVKQFRENLTQEEVDEEIMPRIVNSREEAERLGGATRWINGEKPRWSPSARCFFLVQEPENCQHPAFSTILDGKAYAAVVYYAGGTAYAESAKQIFNAAQINLKEAGRIVLHKKFWTIQVGKKKAGNFTVFVPVLRLTRVETGPELRELASSFGGSRPAQAAD